MDRKEFYAWLVTRTNAKTIRAPFEFLKEEFGDRVIDHKNKKYHLSLGMFIEDGPLEVLEWK